VELTAGRLAIVEKEAKELRILHPLRLLGEKQEFCRLWEPVDAFTVLFFP
jgi:hypothetical protein